jgi:hypothetical protein
MTVEVVRTGVTATAEAGNFIAGSTSIVRGAVFGFAEHPNIAIVKSAATVAAYDER